jgi:hypothetical protein
MTRRTLALVLAASALASALFAQAPLTPTISGDELSAKIQLAGGIGAELKITFEQVVGLSPAALSLTATLVDPQNPSLLARLPEGAGIPAGFPVVVRVEPTASSALSFQGVYRISLYTYNLLFQAPLRFFRAEAGGPFQDMTGFLEAGSVRAGGSGPGFSEFLIVADLRPLDGVIVSKFDTLDATLAAHSAAIAPQVLADLQQRIANARSLYEAGSIPAAINAVRGFGDEVKKQSGTAIPDVWRANSALVNVAGLLRASADTLKFSLTIKANLPP